MYCTKCGAKLPDEARFCMTCGHPVAVPAAQQPQDGNQAEPADHDKSKPEDKQNGASKKPDKAEEAKRGQSAKEAEAPDDSSAEAEGKTKAGSETGPEPEASSQPEDESGADIESSPKAEADSDAEGATQGECEPKASSKTEPQAEPESEPDGPQPETQSSHSADETTLLNRVADADGTTVLSRNANADETTLLPGRGTERAALEQEKSDQVEALSTLYPDVDPGQFCDPTPIEAKSPDITEFIAPAPTSEGSTPASAASLRYAVDSTKKRSRRRVPMIVLVALALALAAGAAYAAYRIYNDIWLPAQQAQQTTEDEAPAEADKAQPQNISYSIENQTANVSVPTDPYYSPGQRTDAQWSYPQIKASASSAAVDKINKAIQQSVQADVDATNAAPDTQNAMSDAPAFTCTSRTITVTYIDDKIVCVRDQRYDTGWGPHGDTTVTGCVYSLETGDTVDPGSVFGLDASQLKAAAGTAVSTYLASDPSDISTTNDVVQDVQSHCTDDPSTTSGLNMLDGSSYFYITNEGLIFATTDYQLGSYAYGRRELVVAPRDGSLSKVGDTIAIDSPMGYQG